MRRRYLLTTLGAVTISGCFQQGTQETDTQTSGSDGSTPSDRDAPSTTSDGDENGQEGAELRQTSWGDRWTVRRSVEPPVQWVSRSNNQTIEPENESSDAVLLIGGHTSVLADSDSGEIRWGYRYNRPVADADVTDDKIYLAFLERGVDRCHLAALDSDGEIQWNRVDGFRNGRVKRAVETIYFYGNKPSACQRGSNTNGCRSQVTLLNPDGEITSRIDLDGRLQELYRSISPTVVVTTMGAYALPRPRKIASGSGITDSAVTDGVYLADSGDLRYADPKGNAASTVTDDTGVELVRSSDGNIGYSTRSNDTGRFTTESDRIGLVKRSTEIAWEVALDSGILDFDVDGEDIYVLTEDSRIISARAGEVSWSTTVPGEIKPGKSTLMTGSGVFAVYREDSSSNDVVVKVDFEGEKEWIFDPGKSLYVPELVTGEGVFISSREGDTWKLS